MDAGLPRVPHGTVITVDAWTATRAILAALLGLSWQYGHWGPVLSLLLIPLVVMGGNKRDRYGVAMAYYLAGSHGLIEGSASFFGPGHVPMGIALWLASAALLAAGWAFADRPWKVVAVLVVDALPPLGLFDWLSPLAGAGVLFPGFGIAGLFLYLGTIWLGLFIVNAYFAYLRPDIDKNDPERLWASITLITLIIVPMGLNASYLTRRPHVTPKGWAGMNLRLGPITENVMADMARNQEWIGQTQAMAEASHAKVVLLPETLTTWWAGNANEVKSAVPKGQEWLVGASVPVGRDLLADGIEAVRGGGAEVKGGGKGANLLFISPFPVPVSMWHPWYRGHGYVRADGVGYEAGWWEPVRKVDGVRAWASICYDQLLPWVWMEGVVQRPQVVLLTNNEWWAKGTGIPAIQRATAWAWVRLIGAPLVETENA
ncbi:conjugal transfer protein TraB [Acidithiobacillus ferrooxidans]|nr:conjugal transfer protein TraB [Acidithiobacillus ferrooxidans]